MALRTLEQVVESFVGNLQYTTQNSLVMANALINDGHELLLRKAAKSVIGGQTIEFESIAPILEEAKLWIRVNTLPVPGQLNAGNSRYYDLSSIRY